MTTSARLCCLLIASAFACADTNATPDEAAQEPAEAPAFEPTDLTVVADTYAPELDVDLSRMRTTDSGLYIEDIVEGTGAELSSGQTAVVHYSGWLPSGTQFDSSRDGEPFETVIGQGRVIDGWDEGMIGMKVGGQRRLVIPPILAYGNGGAAGVIPPGATLVFDIELVEVRD
ncbi:MAG: FKBP-type peptidyl-prolyl cis-trans isomerase [Longimicrobiales bacterium]